MNALTPGADSPTWPAEFAGRYRAAGHWRGETIGGVLRERATAHPDRIALVDPAPGRRTWTYRQLDERADRLAAGFLARGIGKGDRVVVQLPNIGEFFEVVFALLRIGALPVYALPAHRETEISHFCSFTEAVAYVVPDVHDGYDHRVLASRVGQILLVVEAYNTPRSVVGQAYAAVAQCETVMAVLNRAPQPSIPLGYGYGYGGVSTRETAPAARGPADGQV